MQMDFVGKNNERMGAEAILQGKVSDVQFKGNVRVQRTARKFGSKHAIVETLITFASGRGEGICAKTVYTV